MRPPLFQTAGYKAGPDKERNPHARNLTTAVQLTAAFIINSMNREPAPPPPQSKKRKKEKLI
jgi:hypothetical protein